MSTDVNSGFELATQQRRLWLDFGASAMPVACRVLDLHGPLDLEDLRAAMAAAVERHEVLRTGFTLPAGRRVPFQVVADRASHDLGVLDLTDLPAEQQDERIAALASASDHLDANNGPLFGATLVHVGADRYVLVLNALATILDGRSLELLGAELLGGDSESEPLQYVDYAAWQASVLEGVEPVAADGEEPTRIPLAGEPGAGTPDALVAVPLDRDVVEQLARGDDLADRVLALWTALLARMSGRESVDVALRDHGRPLEEATRALGPYERDLPIRVDIAAGTSFAALLDGVKSARGAAEDERERLGSAPSITSRVGFSAPSGSFGGIIGALECTTRAAIDPGIPLQASLVCQDGAVQLRYDAHSITADDAHRVAGRLATLARAAVADPDADVWQLEVLPAEERTWLIEQVAAGPVLDVDEPMLHHRLETQAEQTPEAPAVSSADGQVSYAELNRRANGVARALTRAGVGRGSAVALLIDRSPDLIAAVLGTWKVGAAYVPLNPDHPESRIAFQLEDAGCAVILTDAAQAGLLPDPPVAVLRMDELAPDSQEPNPEHVSQPDDVAYVIYTSGSTGVPKGVEAVHAGIGNYVSAVSDRFGWAESPRRFGLVTTLSTDLGNTSVFGALATGGCLELVPVDAAMDGAAYAAHVADRPVDVLKITPSHLAALLASGDERVLPQHQLVLGGEAAPWELIERVGTLSSCRVTNHYGPTETTVGSLTFDIEGRAGAAVPAATAPIGRPLANTRTYVVDAHDALVPAGVPGELLIGGAGLARGYRNQEEQTAERFVADPIESSAGHRVYRTGDVVRVLADGSLEFLGRADGQIKIRGFRVELGEIEAALGRDQAVERAAVAAQEDASGDLRLAGYVVPAHANVNLDDVRMHVRAELPEYMVPSVIVALDSLPLMANGKLDRAALPPVEPGAGADRDYVEPASDTERRLAAIWADAMSLERVGSRDDFFELGGHSLLATQVIARIRDEFGVQLPLHTLFTAPRLGDLAGAVDSAQVDSSTADDDDELAGLLDELEGLSDEEAEQLLSAEEGTRDGDR